MCLLLGCSQDLSPVDIEHDLIYDPAARPPQTRLTLDLYRPRYARVAPQLLVFIHGGGWFEGSKSNCPGLQVALEGYALACVNYRLSDEALFPAQLTDLKLAIRWLRAEAETYGYEAAKIGVFGHSAGGHLSTLLGTTSNDDSVFEPTELAEYSSAVQAVGSWSGVTDLTQFSPAFTETPSQAVKKKYREKPWFTLTWSVYKVLGGPPAERRGLADLANPLSYLDADDPPVFVAHDPSDRVVPVKQSDLLVKALWQYGIPVVYVRDYAQGHSVYDPVDSRRFNKVLLRRTLEFFAQHLESPAPN
ncbi:MAG: alpha/beta hydrolase [Cyanobacteria bacterium P01_H01_bin.15]